MNVTNRVEKVDEKNHFFGQFNGNNLERKHGNYTNDTIFFIYSFRSNCLLHSFLNLKILKIHFHVSPPLPTPVDTKYQFF